MCAVRRDLSRRTGVVAVRPSGHSHVSRSKPEIYTGPPLLVPATCLVAGSGLPADVQALDVLAQQQVAADSALAFSTIVASASSVPSPGSIPEWNAATRRLYLDDVLVKEFRQPAENQEIVLARFEEQGWPERIDDPLPPDAGPDVRDRLHNTVRRLNRQQNPLLWFESDGQGLGICWRWR